MPKNLESVNASELAAAINAAASLLADGKSVDEIEIYAHLFNMFADTLYHIARISRKQEHLRKSRENPP
jgi:hypothetical protein